MSLDQRVCNRNDVAGLVDAMAAWETPGGHVAGLHVGDVGWHLRLDDGQLDGTISGWWRGEQLVAAAVIEDAVARPRVAPDCLGDRDVCGAVAEVVDALPHDETWTDAQPGSLLRTMLVARGWTLDPDVWTALHLDLSTADLGTPVERVMPTGTAVTERVAVQRAGFEGSTFTEEAWHRMAAGPGFDPALDLVAWDTDGNAVAGATAWSAGQGRCGILEPVATHRDFRRSGHGRRVVLAAFEALAVVGASGVAVVTPGTNEGAVGLYANAGMRAVESVQALTRKRERSDATC